tara:strand:+ start:331 stop:531 length:201 start_codon:yes stop_codon:yes gene_type:complete
MSHLLWAVYLEVCLGSTCVAQEVQRFDPPHAEVKCAKMLEEYVKVPADGQWDSIQWVCKPLHSEGV